MRSPLRVFLAQKPNCPPKSLPRSSLNPPSVTSVTSVRCSPRCASFSPRNQTAHQRAFRRPAPIPLCDLRDLCAMLSPMRAFLAQKPDYPPKSLPRSSLNPPSVTSVTSVRCSFHDGCDLAAVSYSIIAFSARNRKELTATAKMMRRPTITS
jgi:hypothetical protein